MTGALRKAVPSVLAALALLAASTACSRPVERFGAGTAVPGVLERDTIAFLMPDRASTRYDRYDGPLFETRVDALCLRCDVVYANAEADADRQRQQADDALAQGVDAIVLSAVDSAAAVSIVERARAQAVPVIAYDRPIPDTRADFYVSFDNERIGQLIAQSLIDKLRADGATGGLLQVNGSPTDAAAAELAKGVRATVATGGFPVLAEYDTPDWEPALAQAWVRSQIGRFGSQIAGVVAANDGTGGGTIAAFKAAGRNPVPPVTGNDAELAAAQRIVAGEQYNTISKPIRYVAEAAAAVAVQFVHGMQPVPTATLFGTPSQLFTPTVVTVDNLEQMLVDSDELEVSTICTPEYAEDCRRAGLL